MTVRWVAELPAHRAERLGQLRQHAGIEALQVGERVYIRGQAEEGLPAEIRSLPASLYTAMEDGQLVPHQRRTPTARMPMGSWVPLAQWMQIELPAAAFDAEQPRRVAWSPVRTASPLGEANVLLTGWADWASYAAHAPEIRLRRWRFAADGNRRVVVHGDPLPPLPGQRFVEQMGVAMEAGWTWSPPLDVDVLARSLGLDSGDLCLLCGDGTVERIGAAQFAPAIRSAVRQTTAALAQEQAMQDRGDEADGAR